MDKNFINIDDLVRQRLSGSEAEERSGAWRNMRDLLDKEMPQKRVGFFNWRRMFSGMAVLLLLGSISLGGYELSSSVRGTGSQGSATAGKNTATTVLRAKGSASTSSSDSRESQTVVSAIASKGQPTSTNGRSVIPGNSGLAASTGGALASNANVAANAGIAAASTQAGSTGSHNNTTNTNSNTSTNNEYNTTSALAANTNAHSSVNQSVTGNNNITQSAASTGSGIAHNEHNRTSGSGISGHVTGKKTHNNGNGSGNSGSHIASLPLAAGSNGNHATGNSTARTFNAPAATAVNGNTIGSTATASAPVSSNGTTNSINTLAAASTLKAEKARKLTSTNSRNTLATNTRVASILSKAAAAKNAGKHSNVRTSTSSAATALTGIAKNNAVADLPVRSSTPAGATVAATTGVATGSAKVTGSRLHPVGSSVSVPVAAHKPAAGIAKIGATTTVAKPTSSPATAEASTAGEQDNNKKIDKLTLVYSEKYYKTTNDEGYFKMDTISLLRSTTPDPASAKTAAKQNNSTTGGGSNTGTGNNSGSTVANNASLLAAAPTHGKAQTSSSNRNAAIAEEQTEESVANASASEPTATNAVAANEPSTSATSEEAVPASSTPSKKELNASKKNGGSKTMDKLNETFNDLKYHVKGLQFAPGLTAGVNSTFFAPESFKGFQFGFTGELVFSDAVSVMGELKYFHRINNNYSLEDNYYKYTQVGGQYRKELQLNSYSFSTLHSVELPVSVRYTAGKFSFFAGGNFLYTFAINTGAATMPAPTQATFVSSVGDDNAPKIHDQDFASRFGLGYLFGMSFQVAPNLSLDIRNAQTIWDNSGSEGAKFVSGQLYRSPSLQVSIGYRFGTKRSSED